VIRFRFVQDNMTELPVKRMFEFIEVFYNRQRHQPGLGHSTPAEYADRWRQAQNT
jgi:hypothetical protein